MMRTTIDLPDDVYRAAVAEVRGVSLGEALAELVRRGLKPNAAHVNSKKAFPSFNVHAGAKAISLEQTLAAEDDL